MQLQFPKHFSLDTLCAAAPRFLRIEVREHQLAFVKPAGTSRGVMKQRPIWLLIAHGAGGRVFVAECAPLKGLSEDYRPDYHLVLEHLIAIYFQGDYARLSKECNSNYPSACFAFETLMMSQEIEKAFPKAEPNSYEKGILTNGLIWMGSRRSMIEQGTQLFEKGFECIKMKIGAIGWKKELEVLSYLRSLANANKLTLRVDANGAFTLAESLSVLEELRKLNIHSIEQPMPAKMIRQTKELCRLNIVPIALDEELLALRSIEEKRTLLEELKPQFLVLKPGIMGGFKHTEEWIKIAEDLGLAWWITSALESNVGLNAIYQYTLAKKNAMPQGLGTGSLYTNNFSSPLKMDGQYLTYDSKSNWDLSQMIS